MMPPAPSGAPARLRDIHRRATRMRPQEWLHSTGPEELAGTVVEPLHGLLTEAVVLLGELAGADEGSDEADGFDVAWDEGPTSESGFIRAEDRPPGLGDLAFTARIELAEAIQRLGAKGSDLDVLQLAGECDRARRKLRRCIEAVLCAAPAVPAPSLVPGVHENPAEQAIVVRTAYTRFRKTIPECDPAEPASVFRALRTAANAISKLLGGPAFEHVRHSDRAMLRALQERIVRWARRADLAEGVRLHKDFVTTADLLRDINKRQELQAHDDMTMASIRGLLEMGVLDDGGRQEIRDALETLFGRDDELDLLISELREGWDPGALTRLTDLLDRLVPSTRLFPLDFE